MSPEVFKKKYREGTVTWKDAVLCPSEDMHRFDDCVLQVIHSHFLKDSIKERHKNGVYSYDEFNKKFDRLSNAYFGASEEVKKKIDRDFDKLFKSVRCLFDVPPLYELHSGMTNLKVVVGNVIALKDFPENLEHVEGSLTVAASRRHAMMFPTSRKDYNCFMRCEPERTKRHYITCDTIENEVLKHSPKQINCNSLKTVTNNLEVLYPCSMQNLNRVGNWLSVLVKDFFAPSLRSLGVEYVINDVKDSLPKETRNSLHIIKNLKNYKEHVKGKYNERKFWEGLDNSNGIPSKGIKR